MKHTAKKMIALSLAAMLALSAPLALAEDSESSADTQQTMQAPPQMPGDGQQPPEMPEGGFPGDGQQPPEKPDGSFPGGGPGNGQQPPEKPGNGGGPGGFGGGSSAPTEYAAVNTLTESSDNETYASTGSSENAVLVSSGDVTVTGATVTKTGDSDGESADFYGINAAMLATGGATLTLENASITSNGTHANGVFSYGSGTTVNISDSTIITTGNNSGGIMTTGGAAMNATNLIVSTAGNSSAAIRSDRGGGTVNVNGGSYESKGVGSPAIYSTADITVKDASLYASSSEAVVIEGGNSVTLDHVTVTGNDAILNGQSTVKTNVLIYQSMSGDAAEGNSSFTQTGGSMIALTGDMFHVTNVTTTVTLTGVDFTTAQDSTVFLSASADAWGSSGKNGGHVTLNLVNQTVSGDLTADSVSSLNVSLTDGSVLTGAINAANASQDVAVSIDGTSTWVLTGDSCVTSFTGDMSRVNLNGYTLYVNGEAVN